MVTKKKKSRIVNEASGLLNQYKEKILEFLVSFLEGQLKTVVEWAKNAAQFKQMIKKFVVASALSIAGIVLLLVGLSQYLQSILTIPDFAVNGLLGVTLLIVALLYTKA